MSNEEGGREGGRERKTGGSMVVMEDWLSYDDRPVKSYYILTLITGDQFV